MTLGYDGATLTEMITDTVSNATFTTSYDINIPGIVGSDVGYVGFTGGTGGLSAVQDILSWTLQTTIQKHDSTSQTGSGGPSTGTQVLASIRDELHEFEHDVLANGVARAARFAGG